MSTSSNGKAHGKTNGNGVHGATLIAQSQAVSVPLSLYERLVQLRITTGLPISTLVTEACNRFLDQPDQKTIDSLTLQRDIFVTERKLLGLKAKQQQVLASKPRRKHTKRKHTKQIQQ